MWRVAFVTILLVGCVTPYQPEGFTGGYRNMQISDDVHQVSFAGNGYTHANLVVGYWLRRCAEIAAENGAPYFEVLAENGQTTTSQMGGGVSCSGTARGNDIDVDCSQRPTWNIQKHSIAGKIKLHKTKPVNDANVYATQIILSNLAH